MAGPTVSTWHYGQRLLLAERVNERLREFKEGPLISIQNIKPYWGDDTHSQEKYKLVYETVRTIFVKKHIMWNVGWRQ